MRLKEHFLLFKKNKFLFSILADNCPNLERLIVKHCDKLSNM